MQSSNHITPNGIATGELTSYLAVATLCTTDLEGYCNFYCDILEMQIEGPFEIDESEKVKQKRFWHIPDDFDFDLYHIFRKSVPSLIHLRVLHLKHKAPKIHNSYNSYELGTFSLGIPTSDAYALHDKLTKQGIKSMAPTQVGDIIRADGVPGQYIETIYQGPDFLHIVGIERVGISQLAPCDPKNGIGGPGYSALVVKDSDAEIAFFTKVLDHSVLIDAEWKTSEGSALGTGPNVPYRFTSIYPKGQEQNYIIILEFLNGKSIDTGIPSHPPNKGLNMYTYQTSDIHEVIKRAKSIQIKICSDIQERNDFILGKGLMCILQTPSGLFVEIFEKS